MTLSAPESAAEARGRAIAAGIERVIAWVGSPSSLVIHTIAFVLFFTASLVHVVDWNTMLLVLTTVVSLEAIYLAIFIQFSVNRQAASLKEVEKDVESIQEDVDELGENVEEIKEDVGELGENVEEIKEDVGELGESVEGIKEDVGELEEHFEDIKEDVEEIQEDISEDVAEEAAEDAEKRRQAEMLETLTNDVKAMLKHLETLKGR